MERAPHPPATGTIGDFARRVLAGAMIVAVLLALWQISQVLVLGFGGVVVAVVLRTMAEPVQRYLRVSDHIALLIVTLGLLTLAVGFFTFFGALAVAQFTALLQEIPGAVVSARKWLESYAEGRWFLTLLGNSGAPSGETLLQAIPLAGGVLGGLGEALLIVLIGIYLAADPNAYVRGVVRLFPPHRRVRVNHILHAMAAALQKWLTGMALDMLFVGIVTGLGLWIVGVPLWFALGVLTGVSVAVPYIGPTIATVPGVLLALSVSPVLAFYAALVYAAALMVEGNVTQPLLQRWAVSLSPVVNLLAIVAFGIIFGLWGAVLATPLAVALSVLIRMAYIEDVLEAGHGAQG
ncbi:MAG TPA: AI-2E family transporter [Rhizomicrobium sp.]|jgi:predicted PurR-regulated permease PerM|nr:AI-2E family transporter [Rhizomicrobium sp.]